MNKVVTIPKALAKDDDLVIIPRRDYEALLKKQRIIALSKLTGLEKKALERSRKEMARGEYITLEELKYELGGTNRK